MKKLFMILLVLAFVVSMAACGTKEQRTEVNTSADNRESLETEATESVETEAAGTVETESEQESNDRKRSYANQNRVASDDAQMQTDNLDMPTRIIENGTKINMHFGDVIIPGVLNDSDTAKALIEMLPYTVHMSSYTHDFCGTMPDDLPYQEDEVHYGWLNGDIDYAINAPYFTILHSDEEISEQYGYQVNIGVIACELAKIRELSGSYDVLISASNEENAALVRAFDEYRESDACITELAE